MKGYALQQLPERFKAGPHSKTLTEYIGRKYSQSGFRRARPIDYNREWTPDGRRIDKYRWVENVSDGLRKVGDAHDIIKLDHTGFFTDNFQDETVHGEVYQLPARRAGGEKREQYVPAVNDPYNPDCACVDFHSVTDDKKEAARWADSMAEQWAEREREYQAKDQAEQRLASIAEEIETEYKDFRRIARELRASCDRVQGVQIVRELVKDKWRQTKERIHALRKEREKIEREGISYY